jgi:hypothetical protein
MAPVRLITTLMILTLAVPALAIVVTPTEPVFHTGDMIEFSVLNDGSRTIHFSSSVPFVLHNLDTNEVFSFIGLTIVIPLETGSTSSFGVSSEKLTLGTYEIILRYYDDGWNRFTATGTFEFEVGTDVPPHSIGQMKFRFQK